jgi:hypothetical protein
MLIICLSYSPIHMFFISYESKETLMSHQLDFSIATPKVFLFKFKDFSIKSSAKDFFEKNSYGV